MSKPQVKIDAPVDGDEFGNTGYRINPVILGNKAAAGLIGSLKGADLELARDAFISAINTNLRYSA